MALNTIEDVLYHGMKDLLSAEKQFKAALPKLAKAASDDQLTEAFKEHLGETKTQIERLEKGFKLLGRAKRSEKCEAADGLTEEGEEVIEEEGEPGPKDVMLCAAGRKTEHYEIASYEDAVSLAKQLGHSELADLLSETLKEEKAAAKKLESIAKRIAKKSG